MQNVQQKTEEQQHMAAQMSRSCLWDFSAFKIMLLLINQQQQQKTKLKVVVHSLAGGFVAFIENHKK